MKNQSNIGREGGTQAGRNHYLDGLSRVYDRQDDVPAGVRTRVQHYCLVEAKPSAWVEWVGLDLIKIMEGRCPTHSRFGLWKFSIYHQILPYQCATVW